MKNLKFIGAALAAFVLLLPGSLRAETSGLGAFRITGIEGDVLIFDAEEDEWVPASINMPLMEGDRLKVRDDSRMEMHIKGGTYIRLAEDTAFQVLSQDFDTLSFYLASGRAYINTQKTYSVRIDTPEGSAKSWSKSVFMVEAGGSGAEVSVLEGYVDADVRGGDRRLRAGDRLYIDEDRYARVLPLSSADKWERWNKDRDRELYSNWESTRYLPVELDDYAYDFDRNGRWHHVSEHGYVWTPSIAVSVGWSPYRHGRWGWFGRDYVWISYEPWGWAPYHYGRWSHVRGIGWCWVPPRHRAVHWSPGYVGWVYTPDYVAWVPLAPGEVYYGYGYYGPGSVNIINIDIDIHKTRINRVYKNVYVNNAVTVVNKNTFINKKIKYQTVDRKVENPFLSKRAVFGRPMFKGPRGDSYKEKREIKYSHEKERELKRPLIREKGERQPDLTPKKLQREPERTVRIPEREREMRPLITPYKERAKEPEKIVRIPERKKEDPLKVKREERIAPDLRFNPPSRKKFEEAGPKPPVISRDLRERVGKEAPREETKKKNGTEEGRNKKEYSFKMKNGWKRPM